MRNISVNAAAKLAQITGTEPINIIAIRWEDNEILYADKTINSIPGKILALSGLDSVVNISGNSTSTEVSITLDDIDGSIKEIMGRIDIHKKTCNIYQSFEGLAFSDKVLLLTGEISSPITWSESDRSISFSVLSKLEEKEIGFSPEQGRFSFIADEAVGKPWPLAFGDCLHIPAVKIKEAATGTLKQPIGFTDGSLQGKLVDLTSRRNTLIAQNAYYAILQGQVDQLSPPAIELLNAYIGSIINEDEKRRQITQALKDITELDVQIKKETNKATKQNLRLGRQSRINAVRTMAQDFDVIMATKHQVESLVKVDEYEINLKIEIAKKVQEIVDQEMAIGAQILEITDLINEQNDFQVSSFGVINGSKFPQGGVTDLIINNVRIRGYFSGDIFNVTAYGLAKYTNIAMGTRQSERYDAFWINDESITLEGLYVMTNRGVIQVTKQIGNMCIFTLKDATTTNLEEPPSPNVNRRSVSSNTLGQLSNGGADPIDDNEFNVLSTLEQAVTFEQGYLFPQINFPKNKYAFIGIDIENLYSAAPIILAEWLNNLSLNEIEELPTSNMWYAEAGTTVLQADRYEVEYVANILPSDIKAVCAYKIVDNIKKLVTVPSSYYTADESNGEIVGLSLTTVTVKKPLSSFVGQQWEDQLYVSLSSTIGPNTAEILRWMINEYSSLSADSTSFDYVANRLANYPSHFCLFDQKNLVTALQEIAWQARCSIWLSDGIFYIKYLSEVPTIVDTVDANTIASQSLSVGLTSTEDVVTKFVASWKSDYAQTEFNKTTLRHNVTKYGSIEKDFDFYIYNIEALVVKSATFWLIRKANTWKNLAFNVYLDKLKVEVFDALTFDIVGIVADGSVTCFVTNCVYDSDNNIISISGDTSVKSGTMSEYTLYWPADVDVDTVFPTPDEEADGLAGGGPPTIGSSGRPFDFGDQFPSDASNSTPESPINGLNQINQGFPNQRNVGIGPNVQPDPALVGVEGLRDINREAFYGYLLEQLADDNKGRATFKVLIDPAGGYVIATQLLTPLNHKLTLGSPVLVVKDHQENTFVIQATTEFTTMQMVTVSEVRDDYVVAKDIEDEEVNVLLPFSFRKSTYDEETINGIKYQRLTTNLRNWELESDDGVNGLEILDSPYNEDDNLLVAQLEDADGVDEAGEAIFLVDVNMDGSKWERLTTFNGKVEEAGNAPDRILIKVTIKIEDEDREFTTYCDSTQWESERKFTKDDVVIIQLVGVEDQVKYFITHHYGLADWIEFRLDQNIEITDTEFTITQISDFSGGKEPTTPVTIRNSLRFKGDSGAYGIALRMNNGKYKIVQLECSTR